jgi:hypothetical protein
LTPEARKFVVDSIENKWTSKYFVK